MGDTLLFLTLMAQLYGPLNYFGGCSPHPLQFNCAAGVSGLFSLHGRRARHLPFAWPAVVEPRANAHVNICLSTSYCAGTYYRVIQQYMIDMENLLQVGAGCFYLCVCVCVCVCVGAGFA